MWSYFLSICDPSLVSETVTWVLCFYIIYSLYSLSKCSSLLARTPKVVLSLVITIIAYGALRHETRLLSDVEYKAVVGVLKLAICVVFRCSAFLAVGWLLFETHKELDVPHFKIGKYEVKLFLFCVSVMFILFVLLPYCCFLGGAIEPVTFVDYLDYLLRCL